MLHEPKRLSPFAPARNEAAEKSERAPLVSPPATPGPVTWASERDCRASDVSRGKAFSRVPARKEPLDFTRHWEHTGCCLIARLLMVETGQANELITRRWCGAILHVVVRSSALVWCHI